MKKLLTKIAQVTKSKRFLGFFFCLLLLVATILIHGSVVSNSDEGAVINMAWHWWNGQALYTDFHEFLAPGSAALIVTMWHLFGTTYLAAKIIFILACYISVFFMYLIVEKLTENMVIAFFAALCWAILSCCYPIINHNSISSFVAVILLYFVLLFSEKPTKIYLTIIALLCALDLWFLQTKGFLLALFSGCLILFFSTANRLKNIVVFLGAFGLTVFLLFSPWPASALWYNLIILPRQVDYVGSSFFNTPLAIFSFAITASIFAAYKVRKKKLFLVLGVFQLSLYLSILSNLDIPHFAIASFPALIFLFYFINYAQLNKLKVLKYMIVAFFETIALIVLYLVVENHPFNLYKNLPAAIAIPTEISNAKNIYAGPFLPGVYFELNKVNNFDTFSNEVYCDTICQEKSLLVFESTKPEFALLAFSMTKKYNYLLSDSLIGTYVVGNYKFCGKIKNTYIDLYARDHCPIE
jgi:hypothetical protein